MGIDDTIFERITFVFDEHYPRATNGRSQPQPGRNKIINEEFYPRKKENHLVENLVTLSFTGRTNFYAYRLDSDIERVIFRPVIHFNEVVTWIDPLTWEHGEQIKLVYPDGSVELSVAEPDFERLKKISSERKASAN
ncbi:hypothetical protein ACNSOB_03925 [Citrobacter braakii]|uniref:hypothetical protein n=1 Tax=Citrobacter TaxID=544 RepID=UPI0010C96BD8|nr:MULTISPECIES: hypothetical protein [unclassified Citrobacter]TKU68098.1 hypothetical protein FDX10_05325 [Citrobacter sp. wls713]TKV03324.1 hypothetical protein FDX07_04000 [Citrobacter sp. wls621]